MSSLKDFSCNSGTQLDESIVNAKTCSSSPDIAISSLNTLKSDVSETASENKFLGSSFCKWRDNGHSSRKINSSTTIPDSKNLNLKITNNSTLEQNQTSLNDFNEQNDKANSNLSNNMQKKLSSDFSSKKIYFIEQQLAQKKKLYRSISLDKLPDNGAKLRNQIEELEAALVGLKLEEKSAKENDSFVNKSVQRSEELASANIRNQHIKSSSDIEKEKFCSLSTKELASNLNHTSDEKQKDVSPHCDGVLKNNSSCELVGISQKYVDFSLLAAKKVHTSDKITNSMQNKINFSDNQRQTKFLPSAKPLPEHVIREMNSGKIPSNAFYRDKAETKHVTEDALLRLHSSLENCPVESNEEEEPEMLKSTLMPHQKQALAWLLWRERQQPRGGILADDMGLGKTITTISLILKHKEKFLQSKQATRKHNKQQDTIFRSYGTLVICPASLLHQWNKEIEIHCQKGALKVALYHGNTREKNEHILGEFDVVITTYNIVSREVGPCHEKDKSKDRNSPRHLNKSRVSQGEDSVLLKIAWERIILDEAHNIKNYKSVTAQSVFQLLAKYRWALTGTPIHNELLDLYSLIRFLRCSPFDEYSVWKKCVDNKSVQGTERLNTLVKSLLLRRTKDQKISSGKHLISLPEKKIVMHDLKLSEKEKHVYETLFALSRSSLEIYLKKQEKKKVISGREIGEKGNEIDNAGGDKNAIYPKNVLSPAHFSANEKKINGSFLLVLLLRLQQCCNHLSLIQKEVQHDRSFKLDDSEKDISDVVSQMSHLFLEESQNEQDINVSDTHDTESPSEKPTQDDFLKSLGLESFHGDSSFCITSESTKVTAVLKIIKGIRKRSAGPYIDKCIVVSQWVAMLNIIAYHLGKLGAAYHFIKGSMKPHERMAVVEDFNHNPKGSEVMLLSLKAGGVGLNLVGANHLLLIDAHWNPALQNQACDRIYRVGQTKEVFIHRFVVKNTVEEKILQLQEQKLNLAKSVLGGTAQKGHRFTLEDLKLLFAV